MKTLELVVHWVFALFVATVSTVIAAAVLGLIGLKLAGFPIGVKPGPDFHYNVTLTAICLWSAVFLSSIVGTALGVISAPYVHRQIAAVFFPVLVILIFNQSAILHPADLRFSPQFFIEIAGCAIAGLIFYFRSKNALKNSAVTS